jgi:SAM-dependent methyltransferase
MRNDYDAVEYPHAPITTADPDRIAVMGELFGMRPVAPSRCRMLELGCGSGGNLIPLADRHPGSTFLGVDLSPAAIAQGQRRIDALGLTNLRLEQMDVMDFPAAAGEFDYIVAHGLLSWVPPPVRERVLAIAGRHLAPQGMAYVSYNAYPGCHMRAMWRDMMRFHSARFDAPRDKIEQARRMLQLVAHGTGRDDLAHRLAQEESARLDETDDAVIFHDDLAPAWQPYYFHEFAALAAGHDMQFVAEATYSDMLPTAIEGTAAQALRAMQGADPLAFQQYLDFFKLRRFRRSLLCRAALQLQRIVDPALMMRFHYSAPIDAVAPPQQPAALAYRNRRNEVTVTTRDPAAQAALRRLAEAWPASLPFDELAAGAADPQALAATLHSYYAASFFNVHLEPRHAARRAGERPLVWRVARLEASLGHTVPHLHHGVIRVDEAATRGLLQAMDGTRSRDELAAICGGGVALDTLLERMASAGILLA